MLITGREHIVFLAQPPSIRFQMCIRDRTKTVNPPKLYDLTTLQRESNRYYGFTAQQTLDLVQSLYEQKLLTYPRTDSQFITEDMELSLIHISLCR